MRQPKTFAQSLSWQWKAVEYIAYLAVIIIPLWSPGGYLFPFTSMKSFLMMALVAIMIIFCSWAKWKEKTPLRLTWLHGALFLFALALAISAIFGVDPHASWFGTLQHGTGIVYIYAFIVWSILIGSLVRRSETFLPRFLTCLFTTSVVVAFMTFFNIDSFLGNNSYTGGYLLLSACIGIGLFWFYREWWQRTAVALGLAIIFLCPIFLNSAFWQGDVHSMLRLVGEAQGAALGLFVSLVAMILLALTRSQKNITQWTGAILFLMLVGALWYGGNQFVTSNTPLHNYVVEQKTGNRFIFWDIANAGFYEHSLAGFGWGNYDAIFQKYFDPILLSPGFAFEPATTRPHNVFWEYASTTGILGLIAYLLLLIATFISFYVSSRDQNQRSQQIFGITLAGGLLGYFLQNMFIFDTPVVYMIYFSIIGIAMGLCAGRDVSVPATSKFFSSISALVLVLAGLFGLIYLSIMPWIESGVWTKNLSGGINLGVHPQSISKVGTVSDSAYISARFLMRVETSDASQIEKDRYGVILQKLAEDIDFDLKSQMNNYKAYITKGAMENKMIELAGKIDKELLKTARTDLEKAVALNPNSPEAYLQLVQTSVYEQNFPNAYLNLRAAISLAPSYSQGYVIADALLKIAPNKHFKDYISNMRLRSMR